MRKVLICCCVLIFAATTKAQKINYFVSFPNMAHHEAEISIIVTDLEPGPAEFRMSRSSPGRYATHEFGKNVYNVKAFDEKGETIPVNRIDGDVYQVPRSVGYIKLTYAVYGNYADGTYLGIDPSGIHINMPAMFMWMVGADKAPISVHFDLPQHLHWTIATQLKPTADEWTFTSMGLQYFMDCPTKIGDLKYRKWEVKNPDGKSYTFRIAYDSKGDDSVLSIFSEKVAKLVREEQAIFTETPAYDYGMYTFLASINPYVHGDGMGHRNSTMISIPVEFHGDNNLLEVFAHEFFHCWNVKRIRPRSLEPFNFEKSNMSDELWFAEGFTQYYGQLATLRAGFDTEDGYAKTLAYYINTKLNTAGARYYSPIDASREAVFVDAGVAVDKTNFPNMFTSYYPYGASIAMALDLKLRADYNKTLDDLMQVAWKRFGKTEIPYNVEGLQEVLAATTADKSFAEDFFKKYIYGHEPIDYAPLLAKAGFTLGKKAPGKAWIGDIRFSEDGGLSIASNTVRTTPIYDAGLDINDKILKLGDVAIRNLPDWEDALSKLKPGYQIPIVFNHRGEEKRVMLTIGESPSVTVSSFESAGLPVNEQILQFRKNWLGSRLN